MLELEFPYRWYEEGKARFVAPIFPETKAGEPIAPTKAPVFYNPFSKLSRDMTIITVSTYFNTPITIAEPLAGSGVRGIRLLLEANNVKTAYLNDINKYAYKVMNINAEFNGVADRVETSRMDGNIFLAQHNLPEKRFAYVDVDPVGPPVRFVENAFRACKPGGVLGVSATDLAALVSTFPKACQRKYDAITLHSEFSKDLAIRILFGFLARTAMRLGLGVRPLISFYHRHFIRVFVAVERGKSRARAMISRLGWVSYCRQCMYIESVPLDEPPQRRCPCCGQRRGLAGPLWREATSDAEFVHQAAERSSEYEEAKKLLSKLAEEDTAVVGFYSASALARWLRISPKSPRKIVELLRSSGYRASLTHIDPSGLRTDASPEVLKDLLTAA
ncbi:MAG: tRNA (guanine(26)-N(2))-dimethyltransferase [Aigarchaeota archaeon]|nr:tRNA (guanine(26)-N(2))-dimethyltransferase [Candidatus Pelearchaeum maunauluense]